MHEILHCAQTDKRGIFVITTQSLKGEEVSEITANDKSFASLIVSGLSVFT